MDQTIVGLIANIGVYVQLGGTALLLLLFYLLTWHAGVRSYFALWAWAWFALLVALSMVALRYVAAPIITDTVTPLSYTLHSGYLLAKLIHLGLLVAGTWLYCRERLPPGRPLLWLAGAAAFSLLGRSGRRT